MSGRTIADAVLAHIGHAEQWLRRARADYERGELRQAVLRLLLAEAEIRRARESSAAVANIPSRRPAHTPWGILGAVAAAALILAGYALMRPTAMPMAQAPDLVQAGAGRDRLSGIVRFDTGQVLPLIGFPGRPAGMTTGQGAQGVDFDRLVTIGEDGPALVTFH